MMEETGSGNDSSPSPQTRRSSARRAAPTRASTVKRGPVPQLVESMAHAEGECSTGSDRGSPVSEGEELTSPVALTRVPPTLVASNSWTEPSRRGSSGSDSQLTSSDTDAVGIRAAGRSPSSEWSARTPDQPRRQAFLSPRRAAERPVEQLRSKESKVIPRIDTEPISADAAAPLPSLSSMRSPRLGKAERQQGLQRSISEFFHVKDMKRSSPLRSEKKKEEDYGLNISIAELMAMMLRPMGGLEFKTKSFRFKSYTHCFKGGQFLKWLLGVGLATSEETAYVIGNRLLWMGYIAPFKKQSDTFTSNGTYRLVQSSLNVKTSVSSHSKSARASNFEEAVGELQKSVRFKKRREKVVDRITEYLQAGAETDVDELISNAIVKRRAQSGANDDEYDHSRYSISADDLITESGESSVNLESDDSGEALLDAGAAYAVSQTPMGVKELLGLDLDDAEEEQDIASYNSFGSNGDSGSAAGSAYDVPDGVFGSAYEMANGDGDAGDDDDEEYFSNDSPLRGDGDSPPRSRSSPQSSPKDGQPQVLPFQGGCGDGGGAVAPQVGYNQSPSWSSRKMSTKSKEDDFEIPNFLGYDDGDLEKGWNMRFQSIMDNIKRLDPNLQRSGKIDDTLALIGLAQDFLYSAKAYGKIVISEVYLPDEEKTIKPINIGGVAGGSKYLVQDILFKFALDIQGLYGGNDAAAATVAGHELKGLQAYFNCQIPGLCHPLMALVDYRGKPLIQSTGFRLIAMSYLPITRDTLVYGTMNGGMNMHCRSKMLNRMMKRCGEILNVKPHYAGLREKHRKLVFSAADLEGHRGTDGRFYLLDFARTFPCETPVSTSHGYNLTQLFRPEFVKRYKTPLCPDSYSGFCGDKSHNIEIDNASQYLQWNVIPSFAHKLPMLYEKSTQMQIDYSGTLESSGQTPFQSFRLTEILHTHGINVRHLGLVYTFLNKEKESQNRNNCRALLLVEMVGRVLKNDLRTRMRRLMKNLRKPLEQPYRRLVLNYLNLVFGTAPSSNSYWEEKVKVDLESKFNGLHLRSGQNNFKNVTEYLISNSPGLRADWRWVLLERLTKMLGLRMEQSIMGKLSTNADCIWECVQPITRTCLVEIGERVKHMNIITHAEGTLLMVSGIRDSSKSTATAISNLSMAITKFEEVLQTTPFNKTTLRACARALLVLDELLSKTAKSSKKDKKLMHLGSESRHERAELYLRRALEVDQTDPQSLHLYAMFLEQREDEAGAEEFYLRSASAEREVVQALHVLTLMQTLEACPVFTTGIQNYARFLERRGQMDEARVLRERGVLACAATAGVAT